MRSTLLIYIFLSALSVVLPAAGQPWNYVVMLIDDMGATDLSCSGSRFYETPHIDELAAGGARFTTAYSACTVCSPTRAALLTGQYPARLHLTDWIAGHEQPKAKLLPPAWTKELPLETRTIAELLREKGYATGTFGKWHLGPAAPGEHGFEVNAGGTSRGQPATWFPPYSNPALPDGPDGEFLTERLTAEAGMFMEKNKGRPFLLYFPHFAVHTPLGGKREVIAKYRKKAASLPADAPHRNPVYAAMVEGVDDSVGRLRAHIKALGLTERTVFIFTSDNGGLLGGPGQPVTGNPGSRAGKGSAYEGGIRVPLIIHWPGLTKPGTVCADPVITMDLFATLNTASSTGAASDGIDLRPLLRGEPAPARPLYWHYPHYHPGGARPYSAVRQGRWKLIHHYEDDRRELFDLAADPLEELDISTKHPEERDRLRAMLDSWRTETKAQPPVANPAWKESVD